MKGTLIGFITLFLLTALIGINSFALSFNINKVYEAVEATPPRLSSYAAFEALYEDYMRRERFICLTVAHNDLMDIEGAFAELLGAIKAEDEGALIIAKSRLENALLHLRRLSSFGIEGIL